MEPLHSEFARLEKKVRECRDEVGEEINYPAYGAIYIELYCQLQYQTDDQLSLALTEKLTAENME